MTITIDPAHDAEIQAFQTKPKAIEWHKRAGSLAESFRSGGIEPLVIHASAGFALVTLSESDFRRKFAGQEVTEGRTSYSTTLETYIDGVKVQCDVPQTTVVYGNRKVQL